MIQIGIDPIAVEADANKETGQVTSQVIGGIVVPVPGMNQLMQVPATVLTFSLSKKEALDYAELLKKQAEELPDEKASSLIQANNLQGVEELARMQQALTNQR